MMARPRKNAAASRASLLPESAPLPEIPVREQPYPLPEGWKWVRLIHGFAECLDSFRKPVNAAERLHRKGAIPYYGATGQVGWIDDYLTNEHLVLLGEDGAPFFDPLKDKAYIISGKAWVNNHAHILRSRFGESGNVFLMHYLNSFNYNGYINGTTRPKLTQANLGLIPIPLPPREEQERIVGHIESLFARLDEARQKAEAVRDSVALRRAAILHKAFTGELTAKWREEQGISKESWKKFCFRELGECKLGKMLDKQKNQGKLTPYLRNINVRWFEFDLSDTAEMLATDEEVAQLSVMPGDLFICEGGEPGRCAVWKDKECNLIFQKALHRFRPSNLTTSEFVCFYIKYLTISGHLENFFTGTTIKHLTGQSLAKVPVILPTLPEQREIVRILDDLLGREQRIREAADAVVAHIERMKKAILARAFRGKLGRADCPSCP